jgi:Bifunctional DNA primase/polymerase, N-terminal
VSCGDGWGDRGDSPAPSSAGRSGPATATTADPAHLAWCWRRWPLATSGTGNRVGLLDHVDWRGVDGHVVAPPSRYATGVRYRWLRPLSADLPEVPRPLRELLAPCRTPRPRTGAQVREVTAGHPYGRKALAEELAQVVRAPKGQRNHTLYQAGVRLYGLVAGGALGRADVHDGLLRAADLPKGMAPEMHVWSPEELRAFLDHVRGNRLYAAWLLVATCMTSATATRPPPWPLASRPRS